MQKLKERNDPTTERISVLGRCQNTDPGGITVAESLNHSVHIPQTTPTQPTGGAAPPKLPLPTRVLAGIILVSAAVGAGTGAGTLALLDHTNNPPAATVPAASVSAPASSTTAGVSLADLYTKLRPSVVKITATSSTTGQGGTGSGLILDTEGHIATNYHVVAGSNQFDVALSDGTTVSATVVGTDPGDDLAVIQIPPPVSP